MENHKIRVAITQGDINGIGYELIFKTFGEQEMLEICTPIIYGSPKVANYHSNVLQTQFQFSIIKDAKEAREGRINFLSCIEEEVRADLGKVSEEANTASQKALDKALTDTKEGLCDVLVCGPMNNAKQAIKDTGVKPIFINENCRVAISKGTLTQESLIEEIKSLHQTLKRDFRLSNPRIAVFSKNNVPGTEEKDIIIPAVAELEKVSIQAFGPYQVEKFIDERQYEAFDAILAMSNEQGKALLHKVSDADSIISLSKSPIVCTMIDIDARHDIAGKNIANEASIRNAIYTAIDIARHRVEYDTPLANPLPKLYHERPDNGEKLRFSIPKKQEEGQ